MLSLRVSYQQLALVFLLAIAICYAIPLSKYDPFLMDAKELYPKADFSLSLANANIGNITALARSKRSCCSCCCCCWHVSPVVVAVVIKRESDQLMGKKSDKDHCQYVVELFMISKDGTI
ncbi:hypothetical protein X798_03676 [Onchocerca flexuosa]|uniref:Uncharacterized protein n=1 Tax=Onchocerca flexuosa TaxID=387005 RepID=A0A238BX44_9BILA|nr:hypothetical protein X798_03676 [Onchocerca flexuosa]